MSRFSSRVVMIEPKDFGFNQETGSDNVFMNDCDPSLYFSQFLAYKNILESHGIEVVHWQHPNSDAKDCIFANNWFTTLSPPDVNVKTLVLCPMRHSTRRLERREEFVNILKEEYTNVIDLTSFEEKGLFLEGTGSMVVDRLGKQIFMSVSERSSSEVLDFLISQINLISQFS